MTAIQCDCHSAGRYIPTKGSRSSGFHMVLGGFVTRVGGGINGFEWEDFVWNGNFRWRVNIEV